MKKNSVIHIVQEIMPDYLWHILALSNAFNLQENEYLKRYGTFFRKEMEYFSNHREQFVWGNGITSPYSILLFFLPFRKALLPGEYFSYLDRLAGIIGKGKAYSFAKGKIHHITATRDEFDSITLEEFRVIRSILRDCYSEFEGLYENEILPRELEIKDKISAKINGNIFDTWSDILGVGYRYKEFIVVQTYANGLDPMTNANNLSRQRNNFGISLHDIEYTIDLIYHEIGVFTLMPRLKTFFSGQFGSPEIEQRHNVKYQAFESYIEYAKEQMGIGSSVWETTMKNGTDMQMQWFIDYYRVHKEKDIERSLIHAVEEFVRLHAGQGATS